MVRLLKLLLFVAVLASSSMVGATATSATAPGAHVPSAVSLNAADGYIWASGSFKTYVSDGGPVDSTVYFYVNYRRLSGDRLNIRYILLTEPTRANVHLWAYSCYNGCSNHRDWACKLLPSDTWAYTQPNWTVTAGHEFKTWVTNSPDCSGIWGKTWTGSITLR